MKIEKQNIFRYSSIAVFSAMMLLSYQNCGDIQLTQPGQVTRSSTFEGSIDAEICPSLSPRGRTQAYQFSHIYVLNLTTTLYRGEMMIDSNMDGIPDNIDEQLGFDSHNRRVHGILNEISRRTGQTALPSGCSNVAVSPGLTDCDLSLFNISNRQGLDADHDGIPDLVELLRGTNLVVDDHNSDNDNDMGLNLNEILNNTDVNFPAAVPANKVLSYRVESGVGTCNSIQQSSLIQIENLPLVETLDAIDSKPYQNVEGRVLNLSHAAKENVFAFILIGEPQFGTDHKEMYMYLLKIGPNTTSSDIHILATDFVFLGEIP